MGFDFFRKRSAYPILSAASAFALYIVINRIAGNYGWLVLFNFTFVKINPYPSEIRISHDIWAYLEAYVTGFRNFVSSRHIMIYVLVFFLLVSRQGHKQLSPEIKPIITICLLYAGAHFALFPVYEDRFFAFPASLLFLSLIVSLFYSGSYSPRAARVHLDADKLL